VSNTHDSDTSFALFHGGPFARLLGRAGLYSAGSPGIGRRVLVLLAVTWVPPLILSALSGVAFGHAVAAPFLLYVPTYVRLFFTIPVLFAFENVINRGARQVSDYLGKSDIVHAADRPAFESAMRATMHTCDSGLLEAGLVVITLIWTALGVEVGPLLGVTSWLATAGPGGSAWTPAGLWYVIVSLAIYRFLLLRAISRLFIWTGFLRRLANIRLQLTPTHPDRMGGLGTLQNAHRGFAIIGFVIGADVAATIGERIITSGITSADYRSGVIAMLVIQTVILLGPLFVFAPMLTAARRQGIYDYGALASRYVQAFDRRWRGRGGPADEGVLGVLNPQALTNLYTAVRGMQIVPVNLNTVHVIALTVALPILPIASKYLSSMDLVKRAVRLIL